MNIIQLRTRPLLLAATVAVLVAGCASVADESKSAGADMQKPMMAAATAAKPMQPARPKLEALGPPPIPADNKQTAAKIELGKMLFFDPRLGGDASVSCGSCHEPNQGWAFAEDLSRGYPGTVHWRNSQTIVNSSYLGKQFWTGSASSHESQARSAARGGVAGNGESDLMEVRLALIPEYRQRFNDVFGDNWPLIQNAWRAISAFERTLVQTDAPIDNYLNGDSSALSEAQVRGKQIFEGKGGCISCHNGALASDQKYYNVGVPPNTRWEEDGLAQITFRFEQYAKGSTEEMYRTIKADAGLYYRSKNQWDKGKFRTPTLRYTQYTAPYMHNGAFYTLEEVIDFYDRGGMDENGRTTDFPQNKSALIKPLGLSDEEKEDLLAFIEAFSGDEIIIDKPELPDYAPLFTKAELMEVKK